MAGYHDYTNELSGSVKCRCYVGRLGESHLSGFETVTTVLMKSQACEMSLGRECNYITGALRYKPQVLNLDCLLLGETFVCARKKGREKPEVRISDVLVILLL